MRGICGCAYHLDEIAMLVLAGSFSFLILVGASCLLYAVVKEYKK